MELNSEQTELPRCCRDSGATPQCVKRISYLIATRDDDYINLERRPYHPCGKQYFQITRRTPFKDEGTYNIYCVEYPMEELESVMQRNSSQMYIAPLRM